MKKMKILVIGASGLLAGPVISRLDEKGFELRLFSRKVNPSMFVNEYDIVQGDVFNPSDLERAMSGCDAVHITISTSDDVRAIEAITETAKKKDIKLVSLVSGCTVSKENRWFKFIDDKYRSEQMIIQSGIPYLIFRPTWFFESLSMFVRNGKATIIGHQDGLYHFVAADDFGRIVANAFSSTEAENQIYFVYGPEAHNMKDLLERYCRMLHTEIKSVSTVPVSFIRIIAFLTRNRNLKFAASLFAYFEKVKEPVIPEKDLIKMGKAGTDFDTWIKSKL